MNEGKTTIDPVVLGTGTNLQREERSSLLDYAKGIGIVLVVYGHVARGLMAGNVPMDKAFHEIVDSGIYAFHMPLFFFVSGILFLGTLKKYGWLGMAVSKIDTVVYPYLLWSLLQGAIEIGLAHVTNGHTTAGEVLSLLWRPRAQFWFLYALFFVFLFGGALYRRTSRLWTTGVLILAVTLFFNPVVPVDLYLFTSFNQHFIYFALGLSSAPLLDRIGRRPILLLAICTVLFALAERLYLAQYAGAGEAPSRLIALLVAVAGIAFVMSLSAALPARRLAWLAYLGKHSLPIYLAHILAGSGIRIVLGKLLGVQWVVAHLVFGTLCGLAGPILLMLLADRFRFGWLFTVPEPLRHGRWAMVRHNRGSTSTSEETQITFRGTDPR